MSDGPHVDHPTRSAVTDAAVDLVVGIGAGDVSPKATAVVTSAFVDCLACTIAGVGTADAEIVRAWVAALAGSEDAAIAGTHDRAPASLAALANATAAHALDLDDFSSTMMHPSVCLVPALLAVGEREHATGQELGLAYVAGFELFARLCRGLNPGHYARGWHATSTVGTVAVAAAAARLLGLDRAKLAAAMAIAASTAGGLRDNFGTMVKPYHAGNAAFHGIAAAELAARGFSASHAILDGVRSFPAVLSGDPPHNVTAELFTPGLLELDRSGLVMKRFACCGTIHAALEALLELRQAEGLTDRNVRRVECEVNNWTPEIVIHTSASTPAQARFCLEYSLAVALVDGDAGVLQYTEERLGDRRVQDLARRVHVRTSDDLTAYADGEDTVHYASFPAVVAVETTDGRRFSRRVDVARGSSRDPFTAGELDTKFYACAGQYPRAEVDELLAATRSLWSLDDVSSLARRTAMAPLALAK